MSPFDPEQVDLQALTHHLGSVLGERIEGYVVGHTRLRDAVAERLGCSMLEAERVVDTMSARGFLQFDDDAGSERPPAWTLRPQRS